MPSFLVSLPLCYRLDCDMVKGLLDVVRQIEGRLCYDETFKKLKPRFNLVGSIREGTRFGYSNELDLGLQFQALRRTKGESDSQNIAFKVGSDPFSLKKAETSQTKLDIFFNSSGEFQLHRFKSCLLKEDYFLDGCSYSKYTEV